MGPNSTHIGDGSGTAASEGMEARLRRMLAGPSIAFGTAAVVLSYWAVAALHWNKPGGTFGARPSDIIAKDTLVNCAKTEAERHYHQGPVQDGRSVRDVA